MLFCSMFEINAIFYCVVLYSVTEKLNHWEAINGGDGFCVEDSTRSNKTPGAAALDPAVSGTYNNYYYSGWPPTANHCIPLQRSSIIGRLSVVEMGSMFKTALNVLI